MDSFSKNISLLFTDVSRLGSTNGLSPSQPEKAPVYPPTSGHLMAEKMRLGRQDQGDGDLCEASVFFKVCLNAAWKLFSRD